MTSANGPSVAMVCPSRTVTQVAASGPAQALRDHQFARRRHLFRGPHVPGPNSMRCSSVMVSHTARDFGLLWPAYRQANYSPASTRLCKSLKEH